MVNKAVKKQQIKFARFQYRLMPPTAAISFAGRTFRARVDPRGSTLRTLLLEAGHSPYNGGANVINCRGLGTCGTCAVEVTTGTSTTREEHLGPTTRMERLRLSFPPHDGKALETRGLRLACGARKGQGRCPWHDP